MANTSSQLTFVDPFQPGAFRARDAGARFGRAAFRQLVARGDVVRLARGLYVDVEAARACPDPRRNVFVALKRVPHATVCLLTAAWLHGLVDDEPEHVWLAIDRKARRPHVPGLPYRFVRSSGRFARLGVEPFGDLAQDASGCAWITGPARIVVDAIRYAHHLPPSTAGELLHRVVRARGASRAELVELGRAFRVRPAVEHALREVAWASGAG